MESIDKKLPVLYIVVPCYNEEEVLSITNKALLDLLNGMTKQKEVSDKSRILYVNDGSVDSTWKLISDFHARYTQVCGVNLAANSGHQNALMAGMEIAKDYADAIITIDADLQDDILVIPEMVKRFCKDVDIVYGVRKERKTDTWFKRNTALAFYRLMRVLGVKTVFNHADYRLMSRRAVCQLLQYGERNLFLRGIVPLIGYRTSIVYYNRSERKAGESKYPLSKMMNFAIDGITSFSVKPVRMVFFLGLIFLVISLGILTFVLYRFFTGNVVPGWSSLILSLWFIGGCVLMGLGVVGEYIGKIYIEVKHRPRYDIEKKLLS